MLFNIEHRFLADNGVIGAIPNQTVASPRFWHGRSIVGLEGAFGRVWLGRDFTPAYLLAETQSDPWGCETVAQICFSGRGIGTLRNDNSVNYQYSGGGFTFWAQIAEADGSGGSAPGTVLGPDRPLGFAVSYVAGPLYLAYGYENPAGANDKYNHVTANYDFGSFKLWSGFGSGDTNANQRVRAWQLGASVPIGGGELLFGHGQQKAGGAKVNQITSLGYRYALSKRTTLYANVGNDSKATTPVGDVEKNGYDVGIKHNF